MVFDACSAGSGGPGDVAWSLLNANGPLATSQRAGRRFAWSGWLTEAIEECRDIRLPVAPQVTPTRHTTAMAEAPIIIRIDPPSYESVPSIHFVRLMAFNSRWAVHTTGSREGQTLGVRGIRERCG